MKETNSLPYADFSSARLEKFGNAFGFFVQDIKIDEQLGIDLYQDEKPHHFDYLDLATNELSGEYTQDEFAQDHLQRKSWHFQLRSMLGLLKAEEKERFSQDVKYLKQIEEQFSLDERELELLKKKDQSQGLKRILNLVFNGINFNEPNDSYLEKFILALRKNENKPFLIIKGHSETSRTLGKSSWKIGERSTDLDVSLGQLLQRIDSQKYSAIVLVSCNMGNAQPPKVENVPIFYVEGESSNFTKRTRIRE